MQHSTHVSVHARPDGKIAAEHPHRHGQFWEPEPTARSGRSSSTRLPASAASTTVARPTTSSDPTTASATSAARAEPSGRAASRAAVRSRTRTCAGIVQDGVSRVRWRPTSRAAARWRTPRLGAGGPRSTDAWSAPSAAPRGPRPARLLPARRDIPRACRRHARRRLAAAAPLRLLRRCPRDAFRERGWPPPHRPCPSRTGPWYNRVTESRLHEAALTPTLPSAAGRPAPQCPRRYDPSQEKRQTTGRQWRSTISAHAHGERSGRMLHLHVKP